MANSMLVTNSLSLKYKIGVDEEDKDVFKTQTLKNLSSLATDENLIALADGIANIVDYPISTILKEQTYAISK